MAQGAPDNNVPQGQAAPVNPPNPPLVNPAGGNLAETNALGANVDPAAAKANSAQSQNAIVNNPPPGNPEVAHLGGDFVPVDNPGLENAGQAAGHQANPVAAGKGAEPAAGNVGEQPIDSALNRKLIHKVWVFSFCFLFFLQNFENSLKFKYNFFLSW